MIDDVGLNTAVCPFFYTFSHALTSTTEPAHEPGEMVAWVDVDFKRYRIMHDQTTVRVNTSIPRYLKALGEEAGINFSRELQERLIEKLAV